jgi:hypothetical protein
MAKDKTNTDASIIVRMQPGFMIPDFLIYHIINTNTFAINQY